MYYILFTLTVQKKSKITISTIDDVILKESAFMAKYQDDALVTYSNILEPILNYSDIDVDFESDVNNLIKMISQTSEGTSDWNILYTLYKLFKPILNENSISIDINEVVDDSYISVSYSDGSSSKNANAASYGCCKLLNEDSEGELDTFTNKRCLYETYSGKIEDGTNNIGELTGLKVCIEHFDDKPFQVIISDSIYSLKSYREYIYNWQTNGYKTYAKKKIKNEDLIIKTFEELSQEFKKGKYVLFKWTKGHANNAFNEICDKLAKSELGIGGE